MRVKHHHRMMINKHVVDDVKFKHIAKIFANILHLYYHRVKVAVCAIFINIILTERRMDCCRTGIFVVFKT